MLIKIAALGILAASTPLCLLSTQDPDPGRPDYDQLEARIEAAERENTELRAQLEESLDLLENSALQEERRNCTPSRRLLTQYQFMNRYGHGERAERVLDRVVEQAGDSTSDLESLARRLMTDKETTGQFDEAALALVDRMAPKVDNGDARAFDTMALAHFLNGDAEQAIAFQRIAIRKDDSSDYRRRLRTYEASLQFASRTATLLPAILGQDQ